MSAPGAGAGDGKRSPHVLFVCFGNICRSPLAEAIARHQASERGFQATFESAGVGALDGGGATPEAEQVAREHGLDLSTFGSRRVDAAMLARADLVLTMTADQLDRVRSYGARRAHLLTEYASGSSDGVADPIGCGVSTYRATYDHLAREIELALDRLEREAA